MAALRRTRAWQTREDWEKNPFTCTACRVVYSYYRIKTWLRHCRACGRFFCKQCTTATLVSPRNGQREPVCEECFKQWAHNSPTPPYWITPVTQSRAVNRIDCTSDMRIQMQRMMDESSVWTTAVGARIVLGKSAAGNKASIVHGNDNNGLAHGGFEVRRVERIENMLNFQSLYGPYRDGLAAVSHRPVVHTEAEAGWHAQLPLKTNANEVLLWHGTSHSIVDKVVSEGIDPRLGKGIFGHGTYLAENASKSDEYTDDNWRSERCMFLVRVALGTPLIHTGHAQTSTAVQVQGASPVLLRELHRLAPPHNSLWHQCRRQTGNANGWPFKQSEFVVYERCATYPEFLVTYRRLPRA